MKRADFVFWLMLLANGSGCASMEVRVSILDSSVQKSPAWILANVEARESHLRAQLIVADDGRDAFDKQRDKLMNRVIMLREALGGYPQLKGVKLPGYEALINDTFVGAKDNYQKGLLELDRSRDVEITEQQRHDAVFQADADWQYGDHLLSSLTGRLNALAAPGTVLYDVLNHGPASASTTSPSALTQGKSPTAQEANQAVNDSAANVADSLIGNAGILNDPHASLVVNASNDYWHGEFNKTFGCGGLGNTDIAVKMQSLGDFTLKGVRVDNSKVTVAAFSALTQAVKLVAIAEGVPAFSGLGTASPSGTTLAANNSTAGNAANSALGSGVLTAEQEQQKAEAASSAARAAALAILSAISDENTSVTKDAKAPDVIAAVTRIQDTFEAYKSALAGGPTTPLANSTPASVP